jgi:hypothetical protein
MKALHWSEERAQKLVGYLIRKKHTEKAMGQTQPQKNHFRVRKRKRQKDKKERKKETHRYMQQHALHVQFFPCNCPTHRCEMS